MPCSTSGAGKALFQMLGVFAEFERATIRERVMAGQGTKLGRKRVAR
jgi:DNA invertase Pin-like site-specific DNA recombinase